ncbi:MAG: NAD(P)H-dependent oxidoreductase subunit E [Geodermatophilaceae bacterium]|nr:NAD(P)H-dependent oxidoreductase subunit E [Geodermatophilaceae bacterium]
MDLYLKHAEASETERSAVDELLGVPATRWEGADRSRSEDTRVTHGGREARERRHLLIPVLHAVQKRVGWISEGALTYVARRLTVPPAEVYGVATFYAMFSVRERPATVAHVCDDIACRIAGAPELISALEARVGAEGAPVGDATWIRSPCLGLCERAPAVMFQLAEPDATPRPDFELAPASVDAVQGMLGGVGWLVHDPPSSAPQTVEPRTEGLRLLRRVGVVDPESLDGYRRLGGYDALRRAFALGPAGVIREVTDSKLVGRGGAAFPTGMKWSAVASAPARPHYLICNADESEPGTFKDRVLMESDPFGLIEAMTVAGYATGCARGYLYIRGEYPLATRRLENAIGLARARGFLGPNIMGRGFDFDIELRRGAGAYICGEETALMNSIEGYRGEPRNKPPFPTVAGLFGKPTLINNVETLVNVLEVIRETGPEFAAIGTEKSTGTKLFCLSGHIERPGVYEVAFGTTLRQVLDLAGGIRGGRPVQALLLGGAAGTFVPADQHDVALTFEDTRAIEASLGSGVVMPFDDTVDLVDILGRIAGFFRDESCGQCVPCRVGTVRQEEALGRLKRRRTGPEATADVALLAELSLVMKDASICGLGQTAPAALQSALALGLLGTDPAEADTSPTPESSTSQEQAKPHAS